MSTQSKSNINIRFDVVWEDRDGNRTFWQCGQSDPEREVEAALKAIEIPCVADSKLVIVCRDRKFADKVESLLKKKAKENEKIKKLISIELFGDLLDNYYEQSKGKFI